jgi:tRNA threonylcarbamoyladenosine biosynthesis protein TsaE
VQTFSQPREQARLRSRKIDTCNADRLEPDLPAPALDAGGQCGDVHRVRHAHRSTAMESSGANQASLTRRIDTEAQTLALGAALGHALTPGLLIFLSGALGAGKTTFARGVLRGLGHHGKVKSPSFSLVELYELSSLYFYHFDFYRLDKPGSWLDAGLRDYFGTDAVCLVEWPEKAAGTLPAADIEIRFALAGEARDIRLVAHSEAGRRCLSALATVADERH